MTALSLPWPLPVAPSDPYKSVLMPVQASARMSLLREAYSTNCAAARIGPTVCELEGPIPIENKSKTLMAMVVLRFLIIF